MKRKIILTFILMLVIITANSIYAATGSVSISANSNKIIKGNTFTVTITGTADENITALQAGLEFDSTKLSLQGKTAAQGFTDLSGGDNEIAILSLSDSGLSKSLTLYTLTFKALENAVDGDTTITITNPELALINNNQEQINIEASNQSLTIEIKSEEPIDPEDPEEPTDPEDPEEPTDPEDPENPTDPEDPENPTDPESPEEPTDPESPEEPTDPEDPEDPTDPEDPEEPTDPEDPKEPEEDDDKDDKKPMLPQTGIGILGVSTIIILTICGIIFYNKYKKIS